VADYASKLLPQALRHAVIIGAPRVLQGIFAAVGDWYTWQLAMAIYDDPNDSSFVVSNLSSSLLFPFFPHFSIRDAM
jgi:hypothetical protein